jgi:Zn-dependent M16 (insulinase) family peptidase
MQEENQELTPLDPSLIDIEVLNELKDLQEESINQQKQIIENQKIIIDHFIPSEEEQKQLKEEEQKQLKETQKLQEEEQKKIEEEEKAQLQLQEEQTTYNDEVLQQLTLLNENITSVEFETQNTNAYMYIIVLGFILTFVCLYIYKLIKKFTY